MIKVKHLTLFKPKIEKKAGIFDQGCQKIELCSILLQPSVAL